MHRRCIICGQEPGKQCVYPRDMAEARRWQNLANLGKFAVDTESLYQHGCVCAMHLNRNHKCSSDLGGKSDAVCPPRRASDQISEQYQRPSVKWNHVETDRRCPPSTPQGCCPYITNKKPNVGMQMKSIYNIGLDRCRGAMIQGNLYSQMRKNYSRQQATGPTDGNEPRRNQSILPKLCACVNCPMLKSFKAAPNESTCPLTRPRSSPAPSVNSVNKPQQQRYSNSNQRAQNNTQKPRSCDRLSCYAYSQKQNQKKDDSHSSTTTSTAPSTTTNDSHRERMPDVRNKCCQACFNCQLRDQESQCSQHTLKRKASSAVASPRPSTQLKASSISTGRTCDRTISSKGLSSIRTYRSSQRSSSLASKYGMNMSSFGYGGGEKEYSIYAVNVLLMNGSRQNKYDNPNPEICVQESDLADCNERAIFPEVDKPSYRVCRAATSDQSNANGKQDDEDEANVLVLEEGRLDVCSPEDKSPQGESRSEQQFLEGMNSNQNQSKLQQSESKSIKRCTDHGIQPGQFGDNWINSPGAANYNKVLELQRSRINELENLLQQHIVLQQTIQARMAELQCQEPAKSANKK
ncbi:uncharacterized protein [Drosophila kikkawai]|uniref:Uncharacterized protein n=1 Tax=Drosophila kikkawai TaxID=30033 RepID=A0A6P4J4F8_DROKI|nr:uncharacterized protein LOC108084173 [Drosophila kikkawai]